MEENDIVFLKEQLLMKGLTDEELRKIRKYLKRQDYLQNDIIVNEGEESNELHLISKGEVSILKWDEDHLFQLPLGRLKEGNMFGEMSFMDASPRAATVKATKETTVWTLSRKDLESTSIEILTIVNKILTNIATINIVRLRESNKSYIVNLRAGLRKLQRRNEIGELLLISLLFLGLFRYLDFELHRWVPQLPLSEYDWSYWFLTVIPIIIIVKSFHIYFDEIGLTFRHWKKTLMQSLSVIAGGIISLLLLKWVLNNLVYESVGKYFINPANQPVNLLLFPLYFAYCCVNELIGRGLLISSFRRFLEEETGKRSVILSACVMGLIQLPVGIRSAAVAFVSSLILGYIFLWQKTLLGVVFIHAVIGFFALYLGLI